MSRPGHALGNRLGISQEWISDFGNLNYEKNLKRSITIERYLNNFLNKNIRFWCFSYQIIKKRNVYHIILLMNYIYKKPYIYKVFFEKSLRPNWYYLPYMVQFLKVPFPPTYTLFDPEKHMPQHKIKKKINPKKLKKLPILSRIFYNKRYLEFFVTKYRKDWLHRYKTVKKIKSKLENNLQTYLDYPVKIHMINIADTQVFIKNSELWGLIRELLKSFPREQKSLSRNLDVSLFYLCTGILFRNSYLIAKVFEKELKYHKKISVVLNFFYKYINYIFKQIPYKDEKGNQIRSRCLKIQIKGKIGGDMRAVKQVFVYNTHGDKQLPMQTFDTPISYTYKNCRTFAGVLGIKVWIY